MPAAKRVNANRSMLKVRDEPFKAAGDRSQNREPRSLKRRASEVRFAQQR